jgi:LexA-binding, inner membrane-associated putative hydrolase
MPNHNVHWPVGTASGGAYALYMGYGQPARHVVAETLGGAVGGFAGGVLPDWIDTPDSPHHRAEAHSMAITGTAGWILNQNLTEWQSRLRAQADCFATRRAQSLEPFQQFFLWLAEYFCRFLAGLIAGVLAGYASHLVLDFFTPMSLPVF